MSEALPNARFRRSPAGAVALTGLALGLGGWAVANSPLFETRRIDVEGVRHLTAGEVIEAAGIDPGANLVRLSMADVATEVEHLPWVADAAADRDLPSTLAIRIVERTPVGWFRSPDGAILVARDATVLEHPAIAPTDVPTVGALPSPAAPGERFSDPPITFTVAASMGRDLLRHVRSVVPEGTDQVGLRLRGGGVVSYGDATRLGEKNDRLAALLRWARRNDVEIEAIDLRVPEAPSLAPAEGAASPPAD